MQIDAPSFKDVKIGPDKFYDCPGDVSADNRWDRQQKQDILLAWKSNEEALLRAANEGLAGGERPHLQAVIVELERLDVSA